MSKVEVQLLPHQDDFIFSLHNHPAIVGGLGSGKTRAGCMRLIVLLLEDKGVNGLYAMPTYDLLELVAIPNIIADLVDLGLFYTLNKSRATISILGYGNIYFRSYDKPERLVAFEVAHAIVDEIDTIGKEKAETVWRKVSERVRQKTTKRENSIACVTTPDNGVSGFVYDKWVKKKGKGYQLIKASTYDNPFLPDTYTAQIKENYDSILADLYLKGEFVSLNQNKVYWAFDRIKHHTDEAIGENDPIIYYGQDFNVGGNVSILVKIIGDKVYAVDEVITVTTQEIPIKLNHIYKDKKFVSHPDASGGNESANAPKSSLNILKDAGHRIDAPNANPSIRDRINAVNGLLSNDRLFINTTKCPNLTEALEAQAYADNGKPEKFDTHPAIDDFNDALGYLIHRKFPIIRPTVSVRRR